jgi:outer membrane protein OmpA-like peptidoglycan-associated protein
MTDPVGPLNRAFEVLRRQIAEHAHQLESGSRAQSAGTTNGAARSGTAGKPDIGELKQRIAERLQAIDPKNPNAERRRKRIFLESTLAWEFGEEVLRDPSFQELLDRLETTLSEYPDIERQFQMVLGKV